MESRLLTDVGHQNRIDFPLRNAECPAIVLATGQRSQQSAVKTFKVSELKDTLLHCKTVGSQLDTTHCIRPVFYSDWWFYLSQCPTFHAVSIQHTSCEKDEIDMKIHM